jgi:hypothetical protein
MRPEEKIGTAIGYILLGFGVIIFLIAAVKAIRWLIAL